MAFLAIDRLLMIVHGAEAPTDAEWRALLALVKRSGIAGTTMVVYSEGGLPTASQRRMLKALIGAHAVPIAVLTARGWVRFVMGLRSWFNPWLRAFAPSRLREVALFLGMPARQGELIETLVRRLQDEISRAGAAER